MSSWPGYVEAVAAVFAAIGTVAAVMVALFYQPLRERRQMPRLHLEPPANTGRGFPGSWHLLDAITLQVTAERGRNSAEDVEVLATAMWRSRERPDAEPFVVFESRPLPWYESPETDGADTRMHMAPGTSRSVEILKIGSPQALYRWLSWRSPSSSDSNPGETTAFAVHPKPVSAGSKPFVQPYLDWRIRFAVTARNVDSVVYEVDLEVDVKWTDDSSIPQAKASKTSSPGMWSDAVKKRVETSIRWSGFHQLQ